MSTLVLSGVVWLLAACATTNVGSIADPERGYGAYEDERKLFRVSDEHEAELRRRGFLFEDPELQSYVAGITDRLMPAGLPEGLRFRLRVIRDPILNAYSMANGDIYVHVGLIAQLENETQLAHVLAHEMMHTLNRHQLKRLRDFQNKTVAAKIAEMGILAAVGAGVPDGVGGAGLSIRVDYGGLLGLAYAAAVSGYGREQEEEADAAALERIAAAGYAVEEVPRVFALFNEFEDPDAVEAFFYANHPSNKTRAAYTRELIEKGAVRRLGDARVGAAAHRKAAYRAVLENLRLRVRKAHYGLAIQQAEEALRRYGEDPWLHYYKGEAHRRMADDPEAAAREEAFRSREQLSRERIERFEARVGQQRRSAVAAFRRVLEIDPKLALSHRGLGLVAYRRGDAETAREELLQYLDEATLIRDRRYIERILEEIRDGSQTP